MLATYEQPFIKFSKYEKKIEFDRNLGSFERPRREGKKFWLLIYFDFPCQ